AVYQLTFARVPDQGGFEFWRNVVDQTNDLDVLLDHLTASDEFQLNYVIGDREAYVRGLYVNGYGREPDQAGIDYWVNSGLTYEQFGVELWASHEYMQRSTSMIAVFRDDMTC